MYLKSYFSHYNGVPTSLTCVQAGSFGVEFDLVRVSVGLEDTPLLRAKVQQALNAAVNTSNK